MPINLVLGEGDSSDHVHYLDHVLVLKVALGQTQILKCPVGFHHGSKVFDGGL